MYSFLFLFFHFAFFLSFLFHFLSCFLDYSLFFFHFFPEYFPSYSFNWLTIPSSLFVSRISIFYYHHILLLFSFLHSFVYHFLRINHLSFHWYFFYSDLFSTRYRLYDSIPILFFIAFFLFVVIQYSSLITKCGKKSKGICRVRAQKDGWRNDFRCVNLRRKKIVKLGPLEWCVYLQKFHRFYLTFFGVKALLLFFKIILYFIWRNTLIYFICV